MTPTRLPVGMVLILLGVFISAATASLISTISPEDWQGWKIVGPAATASFWLGTFAWFRRCWLAAGILLTIALVAPWGYFYPGALAVLVLAVVSFTRAARRDGARR